MKFLLIPFMVLCCLINCSAQTFRQMFDNLNTQFSNGGYSCYSNLDGAIYSYEYNTMNAYLNMFEATNDIKYLNEFAIHAKRVMDRRDDFISNTKLIHSKN